MQLLEAARVKRVRARESADRVLLPVETLGAPQLAAATCPRFQRRGLRPRRAALRGLIRLEIRLEIRHVRHLECVPQSCTVQRVAPATEGSTPLGQPTLGSVRLNLDA